MTDIYETANAAWRKLADDCPKCRAKGENCGEHLPSYDELFHFWQKTAEDALEENYRLRLLLQELCMDLENEIDGRYGKEIHPAMKRKYDRDMDPCRRARRELGMA